MDDLLADPSFIEFINRDEKPATPPLRKPAGPAETVISEVQKLLEPIKQGIESMKTVYNKDKDLGLQAEADRQIKEMEANKEQFPFFKEVQEDMAKLLTEGRAASLADAYRIAAFDKAKASGRDEVAGKKSKPTLLGLGAKEAAAARSSNSRLGDGKVSLRDILNEAADKVGMPFSEGD